VSGNVVILSVLAVLLASLAVCAALVLTQRWHGSLSLDHDLNGAQKIHQSPVPRIGGVGVMCGLLAGVALGYANGGSTWPYVIKLLICATPVFAAGLVEDLTKRVSVSTRLVASFVSAALAAWALDATLVRLDTPILDELMDWVSVAILFTCFAVGGLTHAVNIIDGLNGLASGAVGLMLAGLAFIAWHAGDLLVMNLCLWGIAALAGFMLLNYPFGRIFLGDGGAYLTGFWLAECAVLLLHRNPNVSTWAVLLVVLYPAWETGYSVYRRQIKLKTKADIPDSAHLHHQLFEIVQRFELSRNSNWFSHGIASAAIWAGVGVCQLAAIATATAPKASAALTAGFGILYIALYRSLNQARIEPNSDKNLVVQPQQN
jgi:UDP-N-acetylmuramyl pentapeptide phosphotransferase/UDP-N-acetylglucosamine-1-phosphate transferase